VFSRGIGRGIDTIQRNLGSTIEGLGNTTGIQALSTYGAGSVARNQAEIDASRAMENDGIATFLGSILAENAPQLARAQVYLQQARHRYCVVPGGYLYRFGLGTAASFLFNYGQLAGENREAQKAENDPAGVDTPIDEGAAFGTAVGQSALETLGGVVQARLISRAGREATRVFSREGAREITRSAAQGAAIEGATEAGQQAGTRVQAGQDLTSAEAIQDLAIAGLSGAILGGTLSGGGSTMSVALRRSTEDVARTDDEAVAPCTRQRRLSLKASCSTTWIQLLRLRSRRQQTSSLCRHCRRRRQRRSVTRPARSTRYSRSFVRRSSAVVWRSLLRSWIPARCLRGRPSRT
jgi:hypothetical protein